MQKVRRHRPKRSAPTACKRMVSGTISLPLRGTFHLSLTVLVHYRSPLVFSLAGWSPRIQSGFHVSGFTQVPTGESLECRLRASNPLWTDFPDRSAIRAFCNSPAALWDDHVGPTTPTTQRPQAFTHTGLGYLPFRSPLLRESRLSLFSSGYSDVSFPQVPSSRPMCSDGGDGSLHPPGFPIRRSVLQCQLAALHGLSQLATSFIGFRRQGIHHTLLLS